MAGQGRHPKPVTNEIGRRIRFVRMQKGISQTKLGQILGVSFQQVQKYEKGINRVDLSSLEKIADYLGCPVATFFPSMDVSKSKSNGDTAFGAAVNQIQTRGAFALLEAYNNIEQTDVQQAIVTLVRAIAQV